MESRTSDALGMDPCGEEGTFGKSGHADGGTDLEEESHGDLPFRSEHENLPCDGEGSETIFDCTALEHLMEVVEIAYSKVGAPVGRGGLNAFCADGDSWAHMLPQMPLAASKKPVLASGAT